MTPCCVVRLPAATDADTSTATETHTAGRQIDGYFIYHIKRHNGRQNTCDRVEDGEHNQINKYTKYTKLVEYYRQTDRRQTYKLVYTTFVSLSVCLSVCLSTHISRKPHGQTSSNFCAVLVQVVGRFLCPDGGVAIRYVLPVFWMMSHNGPHGAYCVYAYKSTTV